MASAAKSTNIKFENPDSYNFTNPEHYEKFRNYIINILGRNDKKKLTNVLLLFALELLITNSLSPLAYKDQLFEYYLQYIIPFFANSLYGIKNDGDVVYNPKFPEETYGKPFKFLSFDEITDLNIENGWAPDDLKQNPYYQYFVNTLISKDYSSGKAVNIKYGSNSAANNINSFDKFRPKILKLKNKLSHFLVKEQQESIHTRTKSVTQKKTVSKQSKPSTKKKPKPKSINSAKNKISESLSTSASNNEKMMLTPNYPGIQG